VRMGATYARQATTRGAV